MKDYVMMENGTNEQKKSNTVLNINKETVGLKFIPK